MYMYVYIYIYIYIYYMYMSSPRGRASAAGRGLVQRRVRVPGAQRHQRPRIEDLDGKYMCRTLVCC